MPFWSFEFAVDWLFFIRFEQTKLPWANKDKSFLFHLKEKLTKYFFPQRRQVVSNLAETNLSEPGWKYASFVGTFDYVD